jgi:4-hydroxy-tetrahydrodipicolinate synthase/2-dehydro-3-deoxy-phosphogluconate/2-dehydro-3-deoxy-6-phosphogalactonate aldolase
MSSAGTADPLAVEGVVAPTVTAFQEDESLDTETTAAHARFVVENGAHGVFPLGTNGEFALLTAGERQQVVEVVVSAVGDEVPVLAGVGAPSTRATVAHAERAVAAGADGIVVVTPYYYPVDDVAARTHYERVVSALEVPVYVYNVPGRTGNSLSLEALESLAELGVAGIKDSSKDVPWLGQAIDANPELTFLAGSDSLLLSGLQLGCSGTVSAVANVFPGLVVDLYDAYVDGDEERARSIQSTVYRVRRVLKSGPYMAGVKSALGLRDVGFDPGPLRDPLRRMNAEQRERLESELRSLELL